MPFIKPLRRIQPARRLALGGLALSLGLAACGEETPPLSGLPEAPPVEAPPAATPPEQAPEQQAPTPPALIDDHCAVLYDEAGFQGVQQTIASGGAFEADELFVESVVVAPRCELRFDVGAGQDPQAFEAGYHPRSPLRVTAGDCVCPEPTALVAWLGEGGDDWAGEAGNSLPLYAGAPVDLVALGWADAARTVEFVADGVVTIASDAPADSVAGGQIYPLDIVQPGFDLDRDGVVRLDSEVFHSAPAFGAPAELPGVDVVEATLAPAADDVPFADCETGECVPVP